MQNNQNRQVQSYSFVQNSPNVARISANTVGSEQDILLRSGKNFINPIIQSRTLSPPQSIFIRETNKNTELVNVNTKNRLYYSQAHGQQEQGVTVFYNQLSPGQIHRKSLEQLQYQNGVLIEQLQQRDSIISMYKSGWQSNNTPINDDLIKSLNLQLAQKNVLIQQFHRSLAQFQQTIKRDQTKISPLCVQQFHNLQTLIIRHEHYPILVTQKLIQTSRQAQTVYIRDKTVVQEYVVKLQQSYKEVTILRQKLVWFERQHKNMQALIVNLRQQLQQTKNYQQQISNLRLQSQQSQTQISNLRQHISNLQSQLKSTTNQISSLKQQINIYITQINNYKQQINIYINQNNTFKQQLANFQNQNNDLRKQLRDSQGTTNIELVNLRQQINVYVTQINSYKQQINIYINQISGYKQQISRYQQQINNLRRQVNRNTDVEQINRYKQQISSLSLTIQQDASNYRQEIQRLKNLIQKLRQQTKNNVRPTSNNNDRELVQLRNTVEQYREQIYNLKRKLQGYTNKEFEVQWEIDNLKKQNQRLKAQNIRFRTQNSNLEDQVTRLNQQISRLRYKISNLENDASVVQFQWRSKYEQSQTIIRRLKQELQQNSYNFNVGGDQWKIKYQGLETKYRSLLEQLQHYKVQLKRANDKLAALDLEQVKHQLRIEIREQIQSSLRIEITQHLKIQWQVRITQIQIKLNQSFENLKQAQEYIQHLLINIKTLQQTIETLNNQIQQSKTKSSVETTDFSVYESKITQLEGQIRIYIQQLQGRNRDLQQAENYILQLQDQIRKLFANQNANPSQDLADLARLNQTIDQLTLQIKEYLAKINELTGINEELQIKYQQLEETYISSKQSYELNIQRLIDERNLLKKQLQEQSNGAKEWEKQKKDLIQKYEKQLHERWEQLNKAEDYINTYTKQSQDIISYLEKRVQQLEIELENAGKVAVKDEYIYKLDQRYEEIKKRLLIISSQTTQSLTSESQYWQGYKAKRKQQLQTIQQTINESLTLMSHIEQTIIVKRQELHRLDLTQLEGVLKQLDQHKRSKGELDASVRQQFESRFYGVLKSASTSTSTTFHQ